MKTQKKKLLEEEEKECGECKKRDEHITELWKMIEELNATHLKQQEEIKQLKQGK